MTLRAPTFLQAGSYTADQMRLMVQSIFGGSPNQALTSGIVGLADYAVTQSGTPSMILKVAAGSAWIVGTQSAVEGLYNFVNDDGTQTVTISTADATNPRIDLVALQVRNTEYSGSFNDGVLTVVKGTAAASPVAPALPADSIVVAQIAVAAGVTSILTANITDKRVFFSPLNLQRGVPAGRIFNTGSQAGVTGGGAAFAAVYGTTSFLRGGMTASGNTLIAPVTGLYRVVVVTTFVAASGVGIANIVVNGSATSVSQIPLNSSGVVILTTDTQLVVAGQAIGANIAQTSGGTISTFNGGSGYNYLSAVLVSV